MRQGFAVLALVAASWLLEGANDGSLMAQPAACAVTTPNHDRPPESVLARATMYPYDAGNVAINSTFGNGRIWTDLWPNGVVVFRAGGPGFVLPDGSLKMKFLWLFAGEGPLTITGRRLDAPASPVKAEMPAQPSGGAFQPSYLIFPTTGCWEVTGRTLDSTLTFVTAVVKTER